MEIKSVLFDLDGTLLPMDQDAFTDAYGTEALKDKEYIDEFYSGEFSGARVCCGFAQESKVSILARVAGHSISTVHYFYEKSGEVAANMLLEILTVGETAFREIMLGYYMVDNATYGIKSSVSLWLRIPTSENYHQVLLIVAQ